MPNLKAKLLIVDDEPTLRTLLSQIFIRMGHPVRIAEDGFAALEEIRTDQPDIILSDLNMPGMSGFELLSVIRRKLPGIYVIATSGAFSGEGVPPGVAADAFHEKGGNLAGLFELVESAVRTSGLLVRSNPSLPIWISHRRSGRSTRSPILLTCPECLRTLSLPEAPHDLTLYQTECTYCDTSIDYATVQPMNSELSPDLQLKFTNAASPAYD